MRVGDRQARRDARLAPAVEAIRRYGSGTFACCQDLGAEVGRLPHTAASVESRRGWRLIGPWSTAAGAGRMRKRSRAVAVRAGAPVRPGGHSP
ncbi:hypothetical protein EASAB2608_07047 [Streptomyces sp. EAS-AB2608]|uniref:Uncharacterized protein n=1 Tax=Streptomyces bangladeshensis TaxID=295352 RepID=A0ABP5NM23_9ACTN|nr:hypothetical protein EASAB2608_07047 [Streptomyces sp. EAS-AB2608]